MHALEAISKQAKTFVCDVADEKEVYILVARANQCGQFMRGLQVPTRYTGSARKGINHEVCVLHRRGTFRVFRLLTGFLLRGGSRSASSPSKRLAFRLALWRRRQCARQDESAVTAGEHINGQYFTRCAVQIGDTLTLNAVQRYAEADTPHAHPVFPAQVSLIL